jgi:hypothetical protein
MFDAMRRDEILEKSGCRSRFVGLSHLEAGPETFPLHQ